MTNFNNYDNNIEVLNEGFFDFIKKWTAKIFHSLFKANDFEDLYNRVSKLEDIIKYGNNINESVKINENLNHKRSRYIVEDDEESTSTQSTDSSIASKDGDEANKNNKEEKRVTSKEVDLKQKSSNTTVNMDKVNMNIPSFPQVAKQLLNGLEKQIKENRENLSDAKIKKDIESVKSGRPLSQRYINGLEIIVTDFLRKYSSGSLSLPKPERNQSLSYDQLQQWQKYTQQPSNNSGKMFAYVHNTMEKIVNDYENQFKKNFEVLKTSEDSFIQKYKNNEKSKEDLQFITDWENKILQKLENIKTSCIEYIPTAINNYFINNKIYKDATNYVLLCLELLTVNSKNIAKSANGKGNSLLNYMNEWLDGDKEDIIEIINQKRDEIVNNIQNNDEYSQLVDELKSINDNVINDAISNIQNIKNIQKYDDNRLSLITSENIGKITNNDEAQGIVLAILIKSINKNFTYKFGDKIQDIFNIDSKNNNKKDSEESV